MAFRLFSRMDTFHGLSGQLLAGGSLLFFEAGTTTPLAVYGDEELSVNNGVTVDLDSSGRPDVDVWGAAGASYFVEVYDADAVKQGEADDVQDPAGAGSSIPSLAGNSGKFLTNNGSITLWGAIREVPDPAGQSGKVLGNDGTNLLWQAPPAEPTVPTLPETGIANTSSTVLRVGTAVIQTGAGTLPATATTKSTVNITFPTAMASCSYVGVQMESSLGTYVIATKVTGRNGTGCTVEGDTNIFGVNFNSTATFTYIAFGVAA